MVLAVVSSWAQTKLGGGLLGCLVIGAFLGKIIHLYTKYYFYIFM
jgi:hypothetical protein